MYKCWSTEVIARIAFEWKVFCNLQTSSTAWCVLSDQVSLQSAVNNKECKELLYRFCSFHCPLLARIESDTNSTIINVITNKMSGDFIMIHEALLIPGKVPMIYCHAVCENVFFCFQVTFSNPETEPLPGKKCSPKPSGEFHLNLCLGTLSYAIFFT